MSRTFVIGDIHGCFTELNTLYNFLLNNKRFGEKDKLIFLGDYIDRGPANIKVLDLLIEIKATYPNNTHFLRGNHEDMFLNFLGLPGNFGRYSPINGSMKLFEEYGLQDFIVISPSSHEARLVRTTPEELRSKIIPEHLEFIKATETLLETDKFIFVHAGLNVRLTREQQKTGDLFWVREDFLGLPHNFGKIIIHGHTISKNVYFNLPYEIGLDTGCFNQGRLSCLELNEDDPIKSEVYYVKAGTRKVLAQ